MFQQRERHKRTECWSHTSIWLITTSVSYDKRTHTYTQTHTLCQFCTDKAWAVGLIACGCACVAGLLANRNQLQLSSTPISTACPLKHTHPDTHTHNLFPTGHIRSFFVAFYFFFFSHTRVSRGVCVKCKGINEGFFVCFFALTGGVTSGHSPDQMPHQPHSMNKLTQFPPTGYLGNKNMAARFVTWQNCFSLKCKRAKTMTLEPRAETAAECALLSVFVISNRDDTGTKVRIVKQDVKYVNVK